MDRPRTANWNVSSDRLRLHHPTIATRQPITAEEQTCIDADFKDRWRTLMSVDDIVAAVIELAERTAIIDSIYFVFTSDHGCR